MKQIISSISFDVTLSKEEITVITKMLAGNKIKFEILKGAQLIVKIKTGVAAKYYAAKPFAKDKEKEIDTP